MGRRVAVKFNSLRSSLVNLPLSLYGPLVASGTRPQTLAVHLLLPSTDRSPAKSAYVGWTGMASASSAAQWQKGQNDDVLETVEIDPQLATSLGFSEGAIVELSLERNLAVAKSVSTEPVSVDDWEILELHAGYVEDNLLAQVRAACIGQEIDVWVLGRTRVRFRVVSLDPPNHAVLFSTNTEVSIAPKGRTAPPTTGSTNALPDDTKPNSLQGQLESTESLVLRVLPYNLMLDLHPSEDPTVWVSRQTSSALLATLPPTYGRNSPSVLIRRLPPPLPANASAQSQPTTTPQPRVLHGTAEAVRPTKENATVSNEIRARLSISDNIPDCHLVGHGLHGCANWDLLDVTLAKGAFPSSKESMIANQFQVSPQSHNLAGIEQILEQAHNFLVQSFSSQGLTFAHLKSGNRDSESRIRSSGLLLCGGPGSGRTSIAKELARRLAEDPRTFACPLYFDLATHSEERTIAVKSLLQSWFDLAVWHKPAVLILDNLDRLFGAEVEHADSFRFRQLAEHFVSVFGLGRARGFVLLATCQSQSDLHSLIPTAHVFGHHLTIKPPDKSARRDILAGLIQSKMATSDLTEHSDRPVNYAALATQTEGYSATDLRDLVARAVHQATIRASKSQQKTVLDMAAFDVAQLDFVPLSLRDVKLQKSAIEWADIGGLHDTKKILQETLEWPTKYAAIFAKCPLRLRSGLLLYGFPGCGKTLLASAVAKECGLNFISVKGPELLNKYIGASEKSVRDLFDRATAAKPCVLFFDEFDSIAPKRGHDSTGVTDRVVNQMLTQMDGAEGLDGVYVLAATSRPDLIDPALLRPGRLDKSLLCSMPNVTERTEILQALGRKVVISSSVDLDEYARRTEGFSGADLQALVYNAHLQVVHASLPAKIEETGLSRDRQPQAISYTAFGGEQNQAVASRAEEAALGKRLEAMLASSGQNRTSQKGDMHPREKMVVMDEHLRESLRLTQPSVPTEERRRLGRIYDDFVSERSGELPVPPDSTGVGNRASLM